ncbi:MAG TPA: YidB family protein [Burkholderiaceae bacterium]|nr:YidB family protein [Burkholderiaceae bacterium]
MSLLDAVLNAVAGAAQNGGLQGQGGGGGLPGGNAQGALLNAVIAMLANGQQAGGGGIGGLGDLIGRFTQSGMGDVIGSWIARGQNAPISGDQLSSVLGSDAIAQIAQQLGLSHGDAAHQLAQILPQAVDRLTPNGEAPADGLGNMGDILAQLSPRS